MSITRNRRIVENIFSVGKPAVVNGDIYFVSMGNVLCEYDTNKDVISAIGRISDNGSYSPADCIYFEGKVVCVVHNRAEVVIYDLESRTICSFSESSYDVDIFYTTIDDGKIWMLSQSLDSDLLFFDIENRKFGAVLEWKRWLRKNEIHGKLTMTCAYEGGYAATVYDSNLVIKNCFPFDKPIKVEVPGHEQNVWFPIYYNNNLYVSLKNSRVLVSVEDNSDSEILDFGNGEESFHRGFVFDDRLYVFTQNSLLYCEEEKALKKWEVPEKNTSSGSLYFNYARIDDTVFFLPWVQVGGRGRILKVNLKDHTAVDIPTCVYSDSEIFFAGFNYESDELRINDFVGYVCNK